ncbi:MAG: PilZ domain-containing protein [Gemmataceae bacterium]|nr:PilZ domain-containing protein [Gemmataceae bacterium]
MPRRANLFVWCLQWLGWRVGPPRRSGAGKTTGKKKKTNPTAALKKTAPDSGKPARRPQGIEAFCRSVAAVKDDPWPARVRDLSSGSIGLVLTRRFEPGTLLVIELEKKTASLSHTLVGRVVHATAQTNGGWMIGCTLANKIAEDDLQALLM